MASWRTHRLTVVGAVAAVLLATLSPLARADQAALLPVTRAAEPVVLTGAQLPAWSRLPAVGTPAPYPSGATDGVRDAHNGTLVVPPDLRTGVPVDQLTGWRWDGGRYVEVPLQVDQRFPYFLANGRSDFGVYSGTDTELTYQWDAEAWKMTAGECRKAYVAGEGPMVDPVATLDDDDEVVFMASDTGSRAPVAALPPPGATARHDVAVRDPLAPATEAFVYLFLVPGGSQLKPKDAYVSYQRDEDADEWIDRHSFTDDNPEKLGSSNTGYGPNLEGTVCDPDGTVRTSTDRFPRDGVTVRTDRYRWYASGRWMVRSLRVAAPGKTRSYGPDLVDRWKGKGVTTWTNPLVVPYYRDDACFDVGTGDDPVARPWPGEASTDPRVIAAYGDAPCDGRQGAWGSHGVHFFATHDTDNGFVGTPVPVDEVDAQQWQFIVPTESPRAVGEPYAQSVRVPLVGTATPRSRDEAVSGRRPRRRPRAPRDRERPRRQGSGPHRWSPRPRR